MLPQRYRVDAKKFPSKKLSITLIVIISALLAVGGLLYRKYSNNSLSESNLITSNDQRPTPTSSPAPAVKQQLEGRYLFSGTIFWGRGIENWSKKADGSLDYAHPFSGLTSFKPELYDAWEADLECPITDKLISFQAQIDTLMFNCRPEYLLEMAKYFQIINLANNHTDNQGAEGLVETRKRLGEAGVQYFGSYDPASNSNICEVIALPVRLKPTEKLTEQSATSTTALPADKRLLPVAFCSWHYFYRKPLAGEIEIMKKYQQVMPVFAFVHMGSEYNAKATDIQREIAHAIADQNPEFVIANNPHWVQDSEVYNGKLIVYSTGNFIFDQLDFETQRSASIDLTITSAMDENLSQWLAIGEQCKTYQDSCLEAIEQAKLKKPTFTLKYDAVAGDSSGRLTKYTAGLQQGIYDRLNWQASMAALKR